MASGVAVVSTAATVMGQRQWCLGARRRWVDGEANARVYEHTVRIVVLEKVALRHLPGRWRAAHRKSISFERRAPRGEGEALRRESLCGES